MLLSPTLIGSFRVSSLSTVSTSTFTCREACAVIFGQTSDSFAGSVSADEITHSCFVYSLNQSSTTAGILADNFKSCDEFTSAGCQSAFVHEQFLVSEINYCFLARCSPGFGSISELSCVACPPGSFANSVSGLCEFVPSGSLLLNTQQEKHILFF